MIWNPSNAKRPRHSSSAVSSEAMPHTTPPTALLSIMPSGIRCARSARMSGNVVIHSGYLLNDLLRWNNPSHPMQREWLHRIMEPIGYKHLPAKKEQGSDVSPDDAVDTPHA